LKLEWEESREGRGAGSEWQGFELRFDGIAATHLDH
tara:strand:- start:1334 stop:1441 length:108 start_codon:yes stop_codon:yes gene_type:complete